MDYENERLIAIELARSDDWATNAYRLRIMREWCEDRGIEHLEMGGLPEEFPYVVLVPIRDAVAFRLKFGI